VLLFSLYDPTFTFFCSQNAMLQEMVEEWEQCERKLSETRDWTEKTRNALDSMTNRRKPIRDQIALRERAAADAAVQKAKIIMALEKLQVFFLPLTTVQSNPFAYNTKKHFGVIIFWHKGLYSFTNAAKL
jgi:hypothetical protein